MFLYARATGTVALVSHRPHSPTTAADADSCCTALSFDGSSLAFLSSTTNLVTGQSDANGTYDVFVYTASTGTVSLISHVPHGLTTTGNGRSGQPSISADGALVVFDSGATDLVAGHTDANGERDVFLYNRGTETMTLVARAASGTTTGSDNSFTPVISGDGSQVVFNSAATDLVEGQSDANLTVDVFVFQRRADPLPGADFDGDGDTDIAVYRPSVGAWFVNVGATTAWGTAGDIPVPGDHDGDGETDIAVYRPSNGYWYLEAATVTHFGASGDVPLPLPAAIGGFSSPASPEPGRPRPSLDFPGASAPEAGSVSTLPRATPRPGGDRHEHTATPSDGAEV
ncbi:MAG: hypothetical protein M3179_03840 [Actinomycetota bacterium]|nr:hypothetical protein [Actinomycetota bacterium]